MQLACIVSQWSGRFGSASIASAPSGSTPFSRRVRRYDRQSMQRSHCRMRPYGQVRSAAMIADAPSRSTRRRTRSSTRSVRVTFSMGLPFRDDPDGPSRTPARTDHDGSARHLRVLGSGGRRRPTGRTVDGPRRHASRSRRSRPSGQSRGAARVTVEGAIGSAAGQFVAEQRKTGPCASGSYASGLRARSVVGPVGRAPVVGSEVGSVRDRTADVGDVARRTRVVGVSPAHVPCQRSDGTGVGDFGSILAARRPADPPDTA